jgi:hypothetical protein
MSKASEAQLNKLSDIVSTIGHTAFAAIVLPAVLQADINITFAIFGFIVALVFWWVSYKILNSLL